MPVACAIEKNAKLSAEGQMRKQRTLNKEVTVEGVGLFTGEKVSLRLVPAAASSGILFSRVDLPGRPLIPARLEYVVSSSRCTMLRKEEAVVQTVEHLMAALSACNISNLLVEISGPEIPIFDGSSAPFVEMVNRAGFCDQDHVAPLATLEAPVYYSHNETQMIALPAEELRISYTLHYPHSPFLGSQFYTARITEGQFIAEIAPSRTFSLYEEVMPLLEKKLIKGGSLENGVIVKGNEVLNPEGVRFPDEMARHKVLDMIGDLALMGCGLRAHIVAIRSGHSANHAFASALLKHIRSRPAKMESF